MHLLVQTGNRSAEEVFHHELIWATRAASAKSATRGHMRPSLQLCVSAVFLLFSHHHTSASGGFLFDIPILLLDQSIPVKT